MKDGWRESTNRRVDKEESSGLRVGEREHKEESRQKRAEGTEQEEDGRGRGQEEEVRSKRDCAGKSVISRTSHAYSVNSKGEMFVYHTLPELTSVSPNVVS